jgi:hypothetical protein
MNDTGLHLPDNKLWNKHSPGIKNNHHLNKVQVVEKN